MRKFLLLTACCACLLPGPMLAQAISGPGLATPVSVPNGGTGVATITGAVKGNGTSAFTQAAAADLSNGTTGTGAVVLAAAPTVSGGLTVSSGNVIIASGNDLRVNGTNRVYIDTGSIQFTSQGTTLQWQGTLLQFSGSTSSFPALRRTGTTLAARLADDSADAPFTAAAGTFSGDLKTTGTIPTVTGTGSPTIATGSTDTAGEVTGGTLATSIVITFAAAKTNAPFCTVTSQSSVTGFSYSISPTAITISLSATTGEKVDYVCFQH